MALSIIIVLAVAGAILALFYVVSLPQPREKFTEFYILGPGGSAEDYPGQLDIGEEAPIILSIVNREHEAVTYHVEIITSGSIDDILGPIILGHNEKFETVANLKVHESGDKQKIEFLLYKEGEPAVYKSLHLWINASD